MSGVESDVWGTGERVVLVHGSLATGPMGWEAQRPLADHGYQLVVPTRRAYTSQSGSVGEDFRVDGEDAAELGAQRCVVEGADRAGGRGPFDMQKPLYKSFCMSPVEDRYKPVTEFFAALASPVRAAIVHLLTDQPHNVSELGVALGVSQPLVSQHLRVLRENGLVVAERVGRTTSYALTDDHVAHVFLDALTHTQEEHR